MNSLVLVMVMTICVANRGGENGDLGKRWLRSHSGTPALNKGIFGKRKNGFTKTIHWT